MTKLGDIDHDSTNGTYVVSGDTKPFAAKFRAAGMKWDGKVWRGSDEQLSAFFYSTLTMRFGEKRAARELDVCTESEYVAANSTDHETGRDNVHTDPYNRDQFGNRVFGQKRIKGGAPDDFE